MNKQLFSVIGRLTEAVKDLSKTKEKNKLIFSGTGTSVFSDNFSKKLKKDNSIPILQEISLKLDTIISKMDKQEGGTANVSDAGKFIKTAFSGSGGVILFMLYKAVKPISNKVFMDFLKILLFIDPRTNKPFITPNQLKNIDTFNKNLEKTSKSLKTIAVSIAIFSLTLVSVALAATVILSGLGVIMMVLGLFVLTMWAVKKFIDNDKDNKKGTPLKSFMYISVSLAIFSLTFIAVALAAPIIFKGLFVFVTVLALFLFSLWIAKKVLGGGGGLNLPFKKIIKGDAGSGGDKQEGLGKTVLFITISVVLFTLAFYFASQFAGSIIKGAFTLSLSLGLISASLFGFYKATQNLTPGKMFISLLFIGAFIFVVGYLPTLLGIDPIQFGLMGTAVAVVITALGGALYAYKQLSKGYGLKDALVLIVTGVAIAVIGYGLKIVSEASSVVNKDGLMTLSLFLGAVVATSVALAASGVGFLGPLLLGAFGGALVLLGVGLKVISSIPPFTKEYADGLKSVILGILDAGLSVGFKGLLALPVLTSIGLGLVPFSLGLMTLSKVDWSFIDKTKNVDIMQPVRQILDSLLGENSPIRKASGKDLLKAFGAMEVIEKAINAIQGLPTAIQNMANLRFFEYSLDKNTGKLKLTGERQLTDDEIKRAGQNIADILSKLLEKISSVTTGSIFSRSMEDFGKGFGAIMSNIGTLVDAVIKMATGTYSVYGTRKNPKTGLEEVYEIKRLPITSDMYKKVGENIKNLLYSILEPLSAMLNRDTGLIGKLFGGDIGKLQDIANAFNPISQLITSVTEFSEKAMGKDIIKVMDNIKLVLVDKFISITSEFARKIYADKILYGFLQGNVKNEITNMFKSFADTIKELSNIQSPFEKFVKTFNDFNKSLSDFGKIFKEQIGIDKVKAFISLTEALNKAIEIGKISENSNYLKQYSESAGSVLKDFSKYGNIGSEKTKNLEIEEKGTLKSEGLTSQNEILNKIYIIMQQLVESVNKNTEEISRLKVIEIPVRVTKLPPA